MVYPLIVHCWLLAVTALKWMVVFFLGILLDDCSEFVLDILYRSWLYLLCFPAGPLSAVVNYSFVRYPCLLALLTMVRTRGGRRKNARPRSKAALPCFLNFWVHLERGRKWFLCLFDDIMHFVAV